MKMKKIPLLLLFFSSLIWAQESHDKTIFLDSKWKETTPENYTYKRIIKDYDENKPLYRVEEYYKSGVLEMEGNTSDKEYLSHEGEFKYYYENGKLKCICNFSKGFETGIKTDWYESGIKKSVSEYLPAEYGLRPGLKTLQFWAGDNKQTVTDGNGYMLDATEEYTEKGNLVNGFKNGLWEGTNKDFKISYSETYENGKLISGKSIEDDLTEHTYTEVHLPPRPKKGLQHFYKYIANKFRINRDSEGISGKIVLSFVIDKDGQATDFTVLRSLSPYLDNEAIRLIKNYPEWSTAEFRGKPVRVLYSIPIVISKQD